MRYRTVKSLLGAVVLFALLLSISSAVFAQDGEGEEETSYCESQMAQFLIQELEFDCEAMVEAGIGLGEIKKAWKLSMTLPGFEGEWEALLEMKADGLGWGSIKQAAQLAGGDPVLMEQYLDLRMEGVDWGVIKHAQVLAEAELYTFEEAVELLQNGMGWGDIKEELGLEGPPPWAGPKDKENNGPPPWAGGWKKQGTSKPSK